MRTSGGYHNYTVDVQYILGYIMNRSGGVWYIRGIHEHNSESSLHWEDIMIHVEEQIDKSHLTNTLKEWTLSHNHSLIT